MIRKPELLSPAGSLEKLKIAVSHGADAVYLAGHRFGLRSAAENFSMDELEEGLAFSHERGARAYVVLNSFLHDSEVHDLAPFVRSLESLGADGVIASDLGVIDVVSHESRLPIHLSTQASCLNIPSARLWAKMGVSRVILGRECSVRDAGRIKRETGLEVELFIHGSMCMAYSGHCTISNYTKGRDSNRGGCAQSCRFEYELEQGESGAATEQRTKATFMSSKDLMGLDLLGLFFEENIDSVKIEGRMRSPLYAGLISQIYREAIDHYATEGHLAPEPLARWHALADRIPHRDYTPASLATPAGAESVFEKSSQTARPTYQFLGTVRRVDERRGALVEVRLPFSVGDNVEVIGTGASTPLRRLSDVAGEPLARAKINTLVWVPISEAREGAVLSKVVVE